MNRAEKIESVEKIGDRFGRSPIAIVTGYCGLNVAEITELRGKIRAADGEYLVAKNTLTRIAIKDTDAAAIAELLTGPNAIAFGFSDPVGVSKAVHEFAKDHEALEIKGAVLDGEFIDGAQVAKLAAMPGLDELRGQLLALFMTPATNLVRLLQAPAQQLVQVLDARSKQES